MLSSPASLGVPAFADSSTVFNIAMRARCCRSFASQTVVAARAATSSAISADYNRVPNCLSGLTPLELLTKSKADHRDLLRSHVWGCPTIAIVLDPELQNDQKLPK